MIINSESVGISARPYNPLQFGKFRNRRTRVQIRMCLYDDDTPMMDIAADSEWLRLT